MSQKLVIDTSQRRSIGITLNLKKLGMYLMHDPTAMQQVLSGFEAAKNDETIEPTERLGAAKFTDTEAEDCWASLFVRTDREKQPGTPGYILTNRFERPDGTVTGGDAISLNLRFQQKNQQAQVSGQVNMQQVQQQVQALMAAGFTQAQAVQAIAAAGQAAPAPQPQAQAPAVHIPQNVAAPAPQPQMAPDIAAAIAALSSQAQAPAPGNGTGKLPF